MPRASRIAAALIALAASAALAQQDPPADPRFSLTIYSSADPATFDPKGDPNPNYYGPKPALPGYGLVSENRSIDLAAGLNTLRFSDVAAGIDPTTVSFTSRTDPAGTSVLEQNYEFDLVSSAKLLEKYVDKTVVIERPTGEGKIETIEGTLMSAGMQGLVIKTTDGGVRILQSYSGIRVADAGGLITKPTLVWKLNASTAGKHAAKVVYQTDGLTWRADYNVLLNSDDTTADIGAWVTLVNRSGAAYPGTRLKLVAGDVQRATPINRQYAARAMKVADAAEAGAGGFVEKSFFEYHLYTLGRTTDLPDNSTKQIELFDKKLNVPAKKIFVYYGLPEQYRVWFTPQPSVDRDLGIEMNKKVDTYLSIDNKEATGLGIPLPAGRVRVFKTDEADGSQQFIGEDVIQHTPKDETVLIKLGSAFDIVGERKQTDFEVNNAQHWATESFEIKIRNHKKDAASVLIKENLYRWTNWQIVESTDAYTKQDYRTIHIPVDVPADGEKVVKFTVKYSW